MYLLLSFIGLGSVDFNKVDTVARKNQVSKTNRGPYKGYSVKDRFLMGKMQVLTVWHLLSEGGGNPTRI